MAEQAYNILQPDIILFLETYADGPLVLLRLDQNKGGIAALFGIHGSLLDPRLLVDSTHPRGARGTACNGSARQEPFLQWSRYQQGLGHFPKLSIHGNGPTL